MLASLSANSRNLCVGLLSTLLVSPGFAAEAIGRVAETSGTVVRIKAAGAPELLGGGSPLATGDVIETQANSGAELRYDDGTVVRLAARSRFTVPEYRLDPQQATEERFVSRLLAGAMRVVTGTIAKRQPRNARFVAHTATIGIRGTDFVVRLCDNDCVPAEGPTVARAGEELAGRVGGTAGDVSALDARGRWRVLPTSAPLREGDQVLTGATGIAVLVLRDGTRIALDPNSRLAIREFRYDEAAPRQGRITLELVDGKAQFASGQLAKQNPERFRFVVGEQSVRVHGTTVGAQRLRFPDDNPASDNPLAAPPPELPKNPTLGMNGEVVLPNGRVLEARRDANGQMRFFEKIDRGEPIGRLPDGSPLYADPAPGTDGSIEWRFELRGDQAVFVDVGNTGAPGATRSEPFAVPVGAALVQDGRLVFTADRPYRENEGSNESTDHATGSARQVASRYSLQTDPDGTVTTAAPPPPVTGSITLADGSRLVSGNPQALNSLVGEFLGARDTFLTQHPPPPPPPPPPPVAQAPLGTNGEVVLPNGRVLEARRDANGQMRFFEKIDRGEPIGRLPDGSPLYANPAPGTDGSIEWRFELRGDQAVFVDVGNTGAPGATRSEPFAVPVGAALVQDGRLVFTADRPYRENEGSNESTDHATGSARQVASRYSLQTDPDGTVTTAAPPPPVTGSITLADGSRLVSGNPQALNSLVGEFLGARDTFLTQHPPPPPPPPPPPVAQAPLGTNGEVVLPNGRVLEARRDANGQMRFFEKIDRGEPIGRLPDGSPLYADPAPGTDGSIEWRFELRGDQAVFVDVGNTGAPGATRSEPFAVPVGAALVQDGRLVFTADRPYRENEGSNESTDHATGSARQVASRYSLQTDPDGTVTTAAPPPPVTGSITLADGSRLVSGNPQALNSLVGEFLGARQAALSGPNPGTLAGPPGTGANTGDSIGAGGSRGRSGSRVGVTDGNVSLFSRYSDELRLARGETAGASDGKPPLKGEIPLTFATLSPDRIDVDRARFFGADATAGDNGKAKNGAYVSVLDGAVSLEQGGREVVLAQGETALAPADGGPPLKVSRGARVTGTGALKLNIATGAPVCRPDESVPNRAAAPRGSAASAAAFDASRIRLSGGEIQGDPGKPKVNTSAPDSPGGKGKGFGPDFANRFSTMEEAARGKGLAGAGRLQGQQNLVGGRYADTFGGGRVNPDGDITLGGDLGGGVVTGRGEQASMFAAGKPVEGKETVFAPVPVTSGDNAGVSTGTASGTTMGGRGGTTFDTIVTGAPSKLPEIKPAADGRLGVIPSIRAVPVMVPIKRPVDDPQGGGSGVPLYVRSGQFGNEIRGVERAIGAKAGAAGGAGDGRTDQQAAGSGGGVMAQRNEQLGVVKDTSAGRINWDAALKINEVVNPGRQ
jgi:hypothetical protein